MSGKQQRPAELPSQCDRDCASVPSPLDDSRVIRALEEYMVAAEQGQAPERDAFLAQHAEIEAALGECLDGLKALRGAGASASRKTSWIHASATEPASALGMALGDFQIVREIGRGGMGVVYEALQLSLGRRVALKVLPFLASLDGKQLQRFKNEAQAAARLHHTNIVPVFAIGCERGVHYYAMQLIEGQNLASLIRRMRKTKTSALPTEKPDGIPIEAARQPSTVVPLSPVKSALAPLPGDLGSLGNHAQATAIGTADDTGLSASLSSQRASRSGDYYRSIARLAASVAEALEHAHRFGVIHRDIKPANLIVDEHGMIWITDFGLAQFHTGLGLTRTGDLMGTLRYMSPEQASGQRGPLDPRADVYSLGATLYELLTLEPMFGGIDHPAILRQILHEEPYSLRTWDRAVPRELETIILKAVSKSPVDRYASAQELADDLHRFLEHKPIHARRPNLAQRARKWGQRHPSVVAATVVVLFLVAVGSLVSTALIGAEQNRTKAAANRERQRAEQAEIRLKIAREAVEEIIQVTEEELIDRPGMEGVRNRLLESALRYNKRLIDEGDDNPDAQAELQGTRAHVEKILADLASLQSSSLFNLLSSPDVRNDLHATDEQRRRITELYDQLQQELHECFEAARDFRSKGRSKPILKIAELAASKDSVAREMLLPEQARRLKQIVLQVKGLSAFRDPEVVAALKLTDSQKERIRDIEGNPFVGPSGHGERGKPENPYEPDRRPSSERVADVLKDVLTPQQASRWNEMMGEPFRGKVRRGPPPGPRGPSGPPPGGP